MTNPTVKPAVFASLLGFGIFYIFRDYSFGGRGGSSAKSDTPKLKVPKIDPISLDTKQKKAAFEALTAYITAINAGESEEALKKMQAEIRQKMGLVVGKRKEDGKFVVTDSKGRVIIMHKV